jgi:Sir2- and TIR-associating SLOG family/SIR2-like domain
MATVEEFISSYSQALSDRNAAVLAGAGLSIPAGLVNWKGLMRSIAREIGLDVEKESDLVAVAQYHLNERGGRQRINQTLVSEFSERATISDSHRILARLPIGVFWTTNYDTLIEGALRESGKRVDVKITAENLATTLPRRDVIVYKMHGDISDAANAVVSKDDYESYGFSRRGQLFSTTLRGDLVSKTFLFLGFSFSDPNVDYILGRVRVLLEGNRREHYCLMRSVQRNDFKTRGDYQYARTKQELQVKDLRRYGIMAVMLDSFAQYKETLRRLEKSYRTQQVFISGSASSYAPWSEDNAHKFLTLLGKHLAQRGMNVITGFGLGVGPHVINGVLDELEHEGTRTLSDRLTLRPFPYSIADPEKRQARWAGYRDEMISKAGVAIFVFGNKTDASGRLVPADGVLEEFKIAYNNGLLVVPVGSTGHVAQTIHAKVSADLDKYFPRVRGLKTALIALKRGGTPNQIVERVLKFIALVASEPVE